MLLIESYRSGDPADAAWGGLGSVTIAGTRPEVLFGILRPGVGLAVWGRPARSRPHAALAGLPPVPVFEAEAEAEGAPARLAAALVEQAPCTLPDPIRSDISQLAAILGVIAAAPAVRGRLRGLPADADAPFRPEPARLRLVCPYQGAGLEWRDGEAEAGCLDRLSVALIKGEACPGHRGRAHRVRPAGGAASGHLMLDLEPA